ncbi:hypothetical protein NDU88_007958 [Pleurodeles waltl]|uniref:Uncharacterized protein n=1 Tax=Pleurodeles waltl TaxID=8319 RepID=A0AAV7QNK4_PLEWA|nr:hypothetical protein NDU88_007958 [Pleurodeles waltl]
MASFCCGMVSHSPGRSVQGWERELGLPHATLSEAGAMRVPFHPRRAFLFIPTSARAESAWVRAAAPCCFWNGVKVQSELLCKLVELGPLPTLAAACAPRLQTPSLDPSPPPTYETAAQAAVYKALERWAGCLHICTHLESLPACLSRRRLCKGLRFYEED